MLTESGAVESDSQEHGLWYAHTASLLSVNFCLHGNGWRYLALENWAVGQEAVANTSELAFHNYPSKFSHCG